jgi:hypothetical protein
MMERVVDFFDTEADGHPVAMIGIMNRSGNNQVFPKTEDYAAALPLLGTAHSNVDEGEDSV